MPLGDTQGICCGLIPFSHLQHGLTAGGYQKWKQHNGQQDSGRQHAGACVDSGPDEKPDHKGQPHEAIYHGWDSC